MTTPKSKIPNCLGCLAIAIAFWLLFGRLTLWLTGLPTHYGLRTFTAQAMMNAAGSGDLSAAKRIVTRYPDMANCTVRGIKGEPYTALGSAIKGGHTRLALYLIDHGANPNAAAHHFELPIFTAISKGDAAVVRGLVEHGASLKPPKRGLSPLAAVIWTRKWGMCKLLRDLGANDVPLAFEAAAREDTQLLRKEVSEHPSVLHSEFAGNNNIVQLATKFGCVESVKELAALGADLDSPLPTSRSNEGPPLAIACQEGDLRMVKTLIQCGAHLDWPGVEAERENGLHYAVLGSHPDVVRYLLDKGCDPNATRAAITGFLLADADEESQSNMQMARMLVSKGFLADKAALDVSPGGQPSRIQTYLLQHSK